MIEDKPTPVAEETAENTEDSPMLQAMRAEFIDLAKAATEIREKIETAKTQTKKRFYHKRLKKNNETAIKLLIAIEKLTIIRKNKKAEL